MNTSRMIEIAGLLKNFYLDRCEKSLQLWQFEKDLEARQLFLAPAEGWTGKNEAERKIAQSRAYQADEVCAKIAAKIDSARTRIAVLDAAIAGDEAERRALEWEVRARMVEALSADQRTGPQPQDQLFDAQADAAVDATVWQQPADEIPEYPF